MGMQNHHSLALVQEGKKGVEFWSTKILSLIAFGDDHNDVGMLKLCGTGVAMGNAIDEVKKAADFVTLTNDEDGVAAFLENTVGL